MSLSKFPLELCVTRFYRQMYGKMKTLIVAFLVRPFPSNAISKIFSLTYLQLLIHKYFRTQIFRELLEIRFAFSPYIYCNCCRVCPPNKMTSETVKRSFLGYTAQPNNNKSFCQVATPKKFLSFYKIQSLRRFSFSQSRRCERRRAEVLM